jgi:hypothetical protein
VLVEGLPEVCGVERSGVILRILVLVAAVQQLIVPIFVNPFTGGGNPLRFGTPSQIEPAGYAFSIWGPIYLLALAYGAWQLTAGRSDDAARRIAPLAIVVYAGSSAWLYVAQHGPLFATMPILAVMAICATASLFIALQDRGRAGLSWWAMVPPFGLYAGWTICATFVNIAEVAPAYGFNRFGLSVPGYALLSLLVLGVLALVLVWRTRGSVPFAATIVWALIAVAIAGVSRGADPWVIGAALAANAAIAALLAALHLPAQRSA